ncbi:transmembrane protein 53 isoform X1 [Vespula squamosa]|uniref:Transmembrane protein 53 isoform X1 n=1 Tax=Vespula squamosa TaxID=30214 RepID=A0ABD2A7U4_VESSQ
MPEKMSDQEDLEYCIMFPSFPPSPKDPTLTSSTNNGQDHKEEFVFVYEEDKRPLVVLLGWAGCQDRYLAKYSAIYKEKSCITLRYTAPMECLFGRRDKMPYIGKRLLQVIAKNSLNDHPIFFHIFSNGGALLYQHISIAMQQMDSPIQSQVKGVIFDSAPGERRVTSLFKAISAIIGGHPLTNIPTSFFITIFLSMFWFFEVITFLLVSTYFITVIAHALGRGFTIQSNPFALMEESYSWPQLFLYSNTDTLIPAADVEKFASRRAERGVHVQLVLFTNSPHVKHYAMYREVYVNTVCSFINECLQSGNPSKRFENSASHEDERIESDVYDAQPGLTKRTKFSELAYIESGFPNCSRSHYLPRFLPHHVDSLRGLRSQNREEKNRLEGLSYFVQSVEQKVQTKELDEESTKFEVKLKSSNSANKKTRKTNPTQKTVFKACPLFIRKGDKVIFNFQHFTSPEKVLREYIRVNVYNKNRLARIDKQKISEALCSFHCDNQLDSDVDPNDSKSKIISKHDNAKERLNNGRKMSARKSKIKQNVNTENARWITKPAHTWQPIKRISATNNIVYEFNPFGNVQKDDALKDVRISKSTTTVKKDVTKAKTRSIASLPKLNPSVINVFEKEERMTNVLEDQASLPFILNKTNTAKNERISKILDNRHKTTPLKLSEIDQDVQNIKANWEQFQKCQYRKKNKYMSNPRMRKLYDILENTSSNINKIKQDVDSTRNQDALKNINKLLKEPKTNIQQDVERIKNKLFSKRDQWTNLKSTTTNTSPPKEFKEDILRKEKKDIIKKRSLFTEKRLWDINNILSFDSNLLNSHENDSLKEKKSSKIKSEVEKYLDDYTTNIDKLDTMEDKDLNINITDSEKDFEENSEKDFDYPACINEKNINNLEKDEIETFRSSDDIEENKGSTNETTNIDTKSIETFDGKNNGKYLEGNAFVEMGCNGLNLSKNVLDQILQSEYLKKDLLSLYPITYHKMLPINS